MNGNIPILGWFSSSSSNSSTTISGTSILDFGNEENTVINTILNTDITNANITNTTFIPISNATTSLDDFMLNGVTFNIENIVDNVSFDIRASAINNASGNYSVKYLITT